MKILWAISGSRETGGGNEKGDCNGDDGFHTTTNFIELLPKCRQLTRKLVEAVYQREILFLFFLL